MRDILKRSGLAFVCTMGILIGFGLLIGYLEDVTHTRLMTTFGWWAVVFTGLIGTPVHELGHWVGCKLFGFQVTDVALFRPIAGQYDGVLGYVSYRYPVDGLWSKLGCFVTGIAPLIFGGVVILLVLRFLTPEVYRCISERIDQSKKKNSGSAGLPGQLWGAFSGFWIGLTRLRKGGIVRGILCLYILTSISMHMSLSQADLTGASTGFLLILVLYLLYGVVSWALRTEYQKHCIRAATAVTMFLCIGLAFCLLMLGISMLIA